LRKQAQDFAQVAGHKIGLGIAWLLLALLVVGCDRRSTGLVVRQLAPPSNTGSAPKLEINQDGNAVLSWLEKTSDQDGKLRFSMQSSSGWSAPITAAEGALSTADFASAFVLSPRPEEFVAFWTEIKDHDPNAWTEFGYVSRSTDGGQIWSHPQPLASDFSKTEHSYLSGSVLDGGTVGVAWLDGRETAKIPYPKGHYHLMAALLYPDGRYSGEKMLDDNVCTCCPTAAVSLGNKMLIAYRDRTQDEIRDMNTIQITDTLNIEGPYSVHHDGWHINACPTNGPALAVRKGKVVVAWFTAANGPHLLVETSSDGGKQFTSPKDVSASTATLGHPAIAILPDQSSILAWIDSGAPESKLLVRRLLSNGEFGPTVEIARGSGFGYPSMRAQGNSALIAWMQSTNADSMLHLARIEPGGP
jgi:hypothetical protein